jgi:hypothetical protein
VGGGRARPAPLEGAGSRFPPLGGGCSPSFRALRAAYDDEGIPASRSLRAAYDDEGMPASRGGGGWGSAGSRFFRRRGPGYDDQAKPALSIAEDMPRSS